MILIGQKVIKCLHVASKFSISRCQSSFNELFQKVSLHCQIMVNYIIFSYVVLLFLFYLRLSLREKALFMTR